MTRTSRIGLLFSVALGLTTAPAAATANGCTKMRHLANDYSVCRFDVLKDNLRIYHKHADGSAYASFDRLAADLASAGEVLSFAMNAGMYHSDRSPVGLLVIKGGELNPLNESSSWAGNFYLKPNGVFFVEKERAGVLETKAFRKSALNPDFATQSGPMLVIEGKLHPRFLVDASSRHIRNGVGVQQDGRTVIFAISDTKVTFHEFGSFFRDALQTPNALYLDGSISRLFAPELERNDKGDDMGPIVGVVTPPGTGQPANAAP